MRRKSLSVVTSGVSRHGAQVACCAMMLLLLAGCGRQEWDGFLWRIHPLGPTVESGFVLCTSRGAFLVDAEEFTMRLLARGEYCAADTKDGYILTSRRAGRSAVLTLYRLEGGQAAPIGSKRIYGRVQDIVPARCFAPYRFAVAVFPQHREDDLVGGTQVGLVDIERDPRLSRVDSTPVLSGFANLHCPHGIVFSPNVDKPGLAASVMLSLPGCRALKALPGVEEEEYEEGYFLLVSGARLVRAWEIGGVASAAPIRYSADGASVLAGIVGDYKIIDALSGQVRQSLDVPRDARVLAADAELQTLLAYDYEQGRGTVFWMANGQAPRVALESDGSPPIATFAGQRAVVTNGRELWILSREGVESHGRLRQIAP